MNERREERKEGVREGRKEEVRTEGRKKNEGGRWLWAVLRSDWYIF